MTGQAKGKAGRPPKGRDAAGNPAPASRTFPQLTVRLDPRVREQIERLARFLGKSQGDAIGHAVDAYVGSMAPKERSILDGLPAGSSRRFRSR